MSTMKKIISTIIVILSMYFNHCSSIVEDDNKPITQAVDIVWTKTGLDSCWIYSMIFMDNGDLFAGTNYGLFFSTDGGINWNIASQFLFGTVTCFYKHSTGRVFAGTPGNGLFTSSDNGLTWNDLGLSNYNISSIAVSNSGNVFVGTRGSGIFISNGLNQDWRQADANFRFETFPSLLTTYNNIIYAGGTGVYRSVDNGKSWFKKIQGLGNWSVQSLILDKYGNVCAGTDNGGFFITSNNGENWTKFNNGLTNTEITSLAINNQGHIFAGTWKGGVYRLINDGSEWENVDSLLTMKQVSNLIIGKNQYLYAGTFKGIFKVLTN